MKVVLGNVRIAGNIEVASVSRIHRSNIFNYPLEYILN